MRKTRRRFLAAVGATLAIAGCQDDGAGPTPEGSPGESPGLDDGTEAPGVGDGTETPGVDDGTEAEDGVGDGTEEDGMEDGTEEDGVGDGTEEEGATDGTEEDGTADGAGEATVSVTEHDEYGEILVDNEGFTLYMFQEDSQDAEESACTDDCASNWPPLTADGEPTAGEGVEAELSTFEREDGDTQVTANGWPLYGYANDEGEGDAAGQGVQDAWYVLDPSGEPMMEGGGTATGTATPTGTEEA